LTNPEFALTLMGENKLSVGKNEIIIIAIKATIRKIRLFKFFSLIN